MSHRNSAMIAALGLAAVLVAPAHAQQSQRSSSATPVVEPYPEGVRPERVTLSRMMTPLTVTFENQPLRDVMDFIVSRTGAELEIFWRDERTGTGLDPEALVSISPTSLDQENGGSVSVPSGSGQFRNDTSIRQSILSLTSPCSDGRPNTATSNACQAGASLAPGITCNTEFNCVVLD